MGPLADPSNDASPEDAAISMEEEGRSVGATHPPPNDASKSAQEAMSSAGIVGPVPLTIQDLLSAGRRELVAGAPSLAEAAFKAALSLRPGHVGANIGGARSAFALGAHALSIRRYRKAIAARPSDTRLFIEFARSLVVQGRLPEAQRLLSDFIDRSEEAAVLIEQSRVLVKLGNRAGALSHARRAAGKISNEQKLALVVVAELELLGDSAGALNLLQTLLARAPDYLPALLKLGQLLARSGDLDAARSSYERVCELEPLRAASWARLADIVTRQQGYVAAEAVLKEALRRTSHAERSALVFKYATLLFDRGRAIEAEELLTGGFDDDELRSVRFVELQLKIDLERSKEAGIETGLHHLAAAGESARHELTRAQHLMNAWNEQAATEAYMRAVSVDPSSTSGHRGLARMAIWRLDPADAIVHLQSEIEARAAGRPATAVRSRTSQGLFGEIVNDLRTDPGALVEIRDAEGDLDKLSKAVIANPHYTGGALMLLKALRTTGKLGWNLDHRAAAKPRSIPRAIYQFWDQEDPPEDVLELMRTWSNENPGYRYTLFNDVTATAWLKSHHGAEVCRAYVAARHAARKADIFRLALLAQQGGIYADADDRCVGPLEPLLATADLVLRQEPFFSLGNNFICARPQHPVIIDALIEATESTLRGDSESLWLSTGPGAMSRAFARAYAADRAQLSPLLVLDDRELMATTRSHCKATYKRTSKNWKLMNSRPRRR